MNDPLSRRFVLEPPQTRHRRYEALRAVCVDQQPQTEVAERFGSTDNTRRRLVRDVRAQCRANQVPPLFLAPQYGRPAGQHREQAPTRPDTALMADARRLSLSPGRR
jgi:hypothetical protein